VKNTLNVYAQAVFAHPQVAWAGLTEAEAAASGQPYTVAKRSYADVAQGWAMGSPESHFVKLIANPKTRKLLGAHIIGFDAANLIQFATHLITTEAELKGLARGEYWIHPALAEVLENALLDLEI
jgi:mycothione reductase